MRDFSVAGGILHAATSTPNPEGIAHAVADPTGILLVCNKRRDGRLDWSPPGGVIDPGESVLEGLTREVAEETSLAVSGWGSMLYSVRVDFVGRDMSLTASVYEAQDWSGVLHVDDPDGVVVDADFVTGEPREDLLALAPQWVAEPLREWLDARWSAAREYAYEAEISDRGFQVRRLDP